MIATSFGIGPFHPAIRWYGRLWVATVTFETEDEAYDVADGVVCYLNGQAAEYINKLGYAPQAS
jgi:hypothetical protein